MPVVDLFHLPQLAGQGEAVSGRRNGRDRADFFSAVIDDMLFIILEDGQEPEVVHDLLASQPDNQTAFFHLLDLAHRQHILHKGIVMAFRNGAE
ncbi:hypothetical protein D3C71_1662790 [compost metagenome]